jgi:N-acetylglutamate synthase
VPADVPALDTMLAAWPGVEREHVGDWTLRFAGGFTGRANSVLALGDPGIPLDLAIARCEAAYAARALPVRFMLREGYHPPGLEPLLVERGYGWDRPALVLAGPLPATVEDARVVHAATPSEDWIETWLGEGGRGREREASARAILARVSQPRTFSLLREDGRPLATALGTRSPGWLGLSALVVRADARRRGLAGAMLGSLAGWARAGGAERIWLEVEPHNDVAVDWYLRLGLARVGAYGYRTAPSIARTGS